MLGGSVLAAVVSIRHFPTSAADFGAWAQIQGPWRFLGMAAAACGLGVPRQAISFGAGYGFGVWLGSVLALVAETVGCVLDFVWARFAARRWVQGKLRQVAGSRAGTWLNRLDDLLASQPFTATLSLRLLPIGNNVLLNLAAGVSRTKAVPFVVASAVGFIPQTLIFALLGSGVAVQQAVQLIVGAALFVLSASLGALILGRRRAETRV